MFGEPTPSSVIPEEPTHGHHRGWAQSTGPRRKTFFAWADAHGLNRESEAANLGFLEHELHTSESVSITYLKRRAKLTDANHDFIVRFEGPGILYEGDRQHHASIALEANTQTIARQTGGR